VWGQIRETQLRSCRCSVYVRTTNQTMCQKTGTGRVGGSGGEVNRRVRWEQGRVTVALCGGEGQAWPGGESRAVRAALRVRRHRPGRRLVHARF